jgi:hypothetical protein
MVTSSLDPTIGMAAGGLFLTHKLISCNKTQLAALNVRAVITGFKTNVMPVDKIIASIIILSIIAFLWYSGKPIRKWNK